MVFTGVALFRQGMMNSKLLRRLCYIFIGVAIANFLVFTIVASFIGGNAGGGMVKNGCYYVGTKHHYTQVSHNVFVYSLWHGYSGLVTHLLAFISVGILAWLDKKEKRELR